MTTWKTKKNQFCLKNRHLVLLVNESTRETSIVLNSGKMQIDDDHEEVVRKLFLL